jgi:tetratricopeptide (TPR) repeat protein
LQALESAVLITPDDPWLRHSLARLYVRLELPHFALGVMADGVGRQPALSAMRYARALIRSAVDDDAGALEDLGQIPVAERTDSMLAMVRRAVIQNMLAQATGPDWGGQTTALLNAAEERAGDDVGLLQSVAFAWNRLGQPEQGRAVFDRLVERAPKITPELQLQHAQWMNRVRDDQALARLLPELLGTTGWDDAQQNQLLALYADHQARQIEAHQEDGDAPAARQLAQAPLPAVPDASLRERTRARLLMAASEYADAAAALEQVLASEPDDADLRLELGRAWARAARPDQARAQAQWLQNNLPGDHLEAQLALLRLWQLIGDDTQVRALSDRLLRDLTPGTQTSTAAAPQNPQALATAPQRLALQSEVLSTAARLERAEGRYAQAVGLFQQALKMEALGENGVPQAPAATPPGGHRRPDGRRIPPPAAPHAGTVGRGRGLLGARSSDGHHPRQPHPAGAG